MFRQSGMRWKRLGRDILGRPLSRPGPGSMRGVHLAKKRASSPGSLSVNSGPRHFVFSSPCERDDAPDPSFTASLLVIGAPLALLCPRCDLSCCDRSFSLLFLPWFGPTATGSWRATMCPPLATSSGARFQPVFRPSILVKGPPSLTYYLQAVVIGDYVYIDGGEVSQLYNGKNGTDPLHASWAGVFPLP